MRPRLRTPLRVARPVAGVLGASGLKVLACLWFAVSLGSVALLPSADDAPQRTVALPAFESRERVQTPQSAPAPRASTSPARRSAPVRAAFRRLRSPHATPTAPAVGVASTGPRPRETLQAEPATAAPAPSAPVAIAAVSDPTPPPPTVEVPPLESVVPPVVPTPTLQPAPTLPPLPEVPDVPPPTTLLDGP